MTLELPHEDIQGNILQGYRKESVAHAFISVEKPDDARRCKLFIARLLDEQRITTAAMNPSSTCINVGLGFKALSALAPNIETGLENVFPAFVAGMRERSQNILGEARAEDQADWDGRHVWLAIYGESEAQVRSVLEELRRWPEAPTISEPLCGETIFRDGYRIEHFGFRDDVSGPVVEGRRGNKTVIGNGKLDENGRWVPIAAGEFILGYPNEQNLDVLEQLTPDVAALFENGTFAAFRDLEQHVAEFHGYVKQVTEKAPDAAAKMFGRFSDGRPIEHPDAGYENDFTYANDPDGARCPRGAHIRRANPRLNGEHRIQRRGMPYGTFSLDGQPSERRGIYFIGVNASIEDQFEFLQRTWLNGPSITGAGGVDPIATSCPAVRNMVIEGDEGAERKPVLLREIPQFVTFRGGEYYFIPGLNGLRRLCGSVEPIVAAPRSTSSAPPPRPALTVSAVFTMVRETFKELSGLGTAARWWKARIGAGGLCVQEFSIVLGVRGDEKELEKLLEEENVRDDVYAGVDGLQSLRWVLFDPTADSQSVDSESGPRVLVLSVLFDGEPDDLVESLVQKVDLRPILLFCRGFERGADVATFLKKQRVAPGFLLRDVGPLKKNLPEGEFVLDATRKEITEAVRLQQSFEEFYDANMETRGRAQSFLSKFGELWALVPLTEFERRQPDEDRWIRRLSELSVAVQKTVARTTTDRKLHRGAHAKGRGLLEGTMKVVEAAEPACQKGIFATPHAEFSVQVRISNGSPSRQSDGKRDARGFSIRVAPSPGSRFLGFVQQEPAVQDFVLFSSPEFFATDVRQFTMIFGILATRPLPAQLARGVGFLFSKARSVAPLVRVARTLFRAAISHPLAIEYHSATPYLLGDQLVVKYSAMARDAARLAKLARVKSDDFLADALEYAPDGKSLVVDFFVHVLPIAKKHLSPEQVRDIVEDATADWDALGATRVKVAELWLTAADAKDRSDLERAETIQFNPWNSLVEHRPLGSLNRARLVAYRDSARARAATAAGRESRTTEPPVSGINSSATQAAE